MTLTASIGLTRGEFTLDVDVAVDDGELVAVLGPNGAGKTSVLHALAGLVPIERGHIELDSVTIDDPQQGVLVAPEQRPLGVVFQDHALFPHLTALDNVAFGLRARQRHSHRDARRRARSWLERLGVAERAHARPRELSGGEAQRVALARALATEPELLLLDEPLAALDAQTKADVRRDLRAHFAGWAGSCLLVTHDPVDAFALADRVVVIEAGRVTHDGPPHDVVARPRTAYVAELAGTNLLEGDARGNDVELDGGAHITTAAPHTGRVYAVIRPAAVALYRTRPDGSPRNAWLFRVQHIDRLGGRVRVELGGPFALVADVTPAAISALDLHRGDEVWAAVKATEVDVTPR